MKLIEHDPATLKFHGKPYQVASGRIDQVLEIEGGYLILIWFDRTYKGEDKDRNVWKIDKNGQLQWKIQKLSDQSNADMPYTNIFEQKGQIIIGNWVCFDVIVDLSTGLILSKKFTK